SLAVLDFRQLQEDNGHGKLAGKTILANPSYCELALFSKPTSLWTDTSTRLKHLKIRYSL
ncbi:MAG TPA: hypothetical protein VMT46_17030, partial [Anaerolineaceae bacterium]|nr:hypothetical protein [Anaerolineaceae bacterium]